MTGSKCKEYQKLTVLVCHSRQSKCNKNNLQEEYDYLCEKHMECRLMMSLIINYVKTGAMIARRLQLCCDGIGFLSHIVLCPVIEMSKNIAKWWLKGNFVARKANGNKLIRAGWSINEIHISQHVFLRRG